MVLVLVEEVQKVSETWLGIQLLELDTRRWFVREGERVHGVASAA